MTPEETLLISKMMDTFHNKFEQFSVDLKDNTSSTNIIKNSVDTLTHDLLGNGQPGRVKNIEDKLSLHDKFIWACGGGLLVLVTLLGWVVTVLHDIKK